MDEGKTGDNEENEDNSGAPPRVAQARVVTARAVRTRRARWHGTIEECACVFCMLLAVTCVRARGLGRGWGRPSTGDR